MPARTLKPSDSQGAMYYSHDDGSYSGFALHAWNDETCDGYSQFESPGSTGATGTEWSAGLAPTDTDENYGAVWLFDTKAGATCANFIIHTGDNKDPHTDQKLALEADSWSFVVSGVGVFTAPEDVSLEAPFQIQNASAHWVNENTIFWNGTSDNVKLLW